LHKQQLEKLKDILADSDLAEDIKEILQGKLIKTEQCINVLEKDPKYTNNALQEAKDALALLETDLGI